MSNVLTHRFVSPKLDGADATQVQPSSWNDGHRFSGGAAGDLLTRDPADATWGAAWTTPPAPVGWVAYTPIWYISGVVTPLGTHTMFGNYHREGNAVWFQILFVVGSGALPAGDWRFSLPFLAAGTLVSPGTGMLFVEGVGIYPLFLMMLGLADRTLPGFLSPSLNLSGLSATAPATLVAGNLIEVRGSYQAT
jgi:hypothetical protein